MLYVVLVINNRADRVPRSKVFASILADDLAAHQIVAIGSNLGGLRGYLQDAPGGGTRLIERGRHAAVKLVTTAMSEIASDKTVGRADAPPPQDRQPAGRGREPVEGTGRGVSARLGGGPDTDGR